MLERIKAFIESTAGAITVLFFGLCLFSAASYAVAVLMPANDKAWGFFTGLAGGFGGSLLTVITIHAKGGNTEVTGKNPEVTINQAEPKPKP